MSKEYYVEWKTPAVGGNACIAGVEFAEIPAELFKIIGRAESLPAANHES
jgi:hypothetical protein